MSIEAVPEELRTTERWVFSDLRALYVNCTLKRSPERSHTQGLIDLSKAIMNANGVTVDEVRAVDHELAPGVWPDMREHGAERDDWPALYERVQLAEVLLHPGHPDHGGAGLGRAGHAASGHGESLDVSLEWSPPP